MAWPSNQPAPSPPLPSQLDYVLSDLEPDTLRRLAKMYLRDYHRALRRADWLEARERRRRNFRPVLPPLTRSQKKKIARDARNLDLVRKAWTGKSNRELATEYGISPQQVSRIIRDAREKAARQRD